jgi:transposase InsO family protein
VHIGLDRQSQAGVPHLASGRAPIAAESFNSRIRDELLDGKLFLHIDEMKYVVERWRMDYNHYRPHSSLGYMTPAGFAGLCQQAGCIRPHTPVLDGVQDCGILS